MGRNHDQGVVHAEYVRRGEQYSVQDTGRQSLREASKICFELSVEVRMGGVILDMSHPDEHSICNVYSGKVKFLRIEGNVRKSETPLLYSVRVYLSTGGISV